MKLELKTTSLNEIIKKCQSNNIDVKKAKIHVELYEKIDQPGDIFTKLFIVY